MLDTEVIRKLEVIQDKFVYDDDIKLEEDEFLLKIREDRGYNGSSSTFTGFMVQLNKNGTVPKAFKDWGGKTISHPVTYRYIKTIPLKTTMMIEEYRKGWKILGIRNGTSASWLKVLHPYGFTLELAERNIASLFQELTIVKGEIQNECYYDYKNKTIKVKEM